MKKVILGGVAALVIMAMVAVNLNATIFCCEGSEGTCVPRDDGNYAFQCKQEVGSCKDCDGEYDKPTAQLRKNLIY